MPVKGESERITRLAGQDWGIAIANQARVAIFIKNLVAAQMNAVGKIDGLADEHRVDGRWAEI